MVLQGEVAALQEEIAGLRKERTELKREAARVKAQLQDELTGCKKVMESFKVQVECLSREKYDLKDEVERRKLSRNEKIKTFDKMKDQVRQLLVVRFSYTFLYAFMQHHRSLKAAVDLTEKLDKAKKEKKEVLKTVRSLGKKLERAQSKTPPQTTLSGDARKTHAEELYQEERNRNEVCIQMSDAVT